MDGVEGDGANGAAPEAHNADPVEAEAGPVAGPSTEGTKTTTTTATGSKRRGRMVHEAWEALGACDACRVRRTKCIRSDPYDPTCESCSKKQLICTQLRNGGLRYKPRSGKRIQAAAAAFGVKTPSSAGVKAALLQARHRIPMGPNESGFMGANLNGVMVHHLSERSMENVLSVTEMSESMLSQLVDQYFGLATFAVPIVAWNNLQRRFERAGRRLQQLDVLTETLVLACITFAAMSSDHPAIVGPNAPRLSQIQQLGSSVNLTPYSKRRQEFCRPLIDRVANMVEQRGCFRVASPETVSLLGMTADLIGYPTGQNSFELGRPYWQSQAGHIRHMADTRDPGNDISTGTDWHCAIKDAFRSMTDGPSLIMTEEDIRDFFLVFKPKPPTIAMFLDAIHSPDVQIFGPPIASSWYALIHLSRSTAKSISIPFARNEAVPVSTFLSLLEQSSDLFALSLAAEAKIREVSITVPPVIVEEQRRIAGSSLIDHIEAYPLALAVYYLPFAHQWRQWKHRKQAFQEIGVMEKPVEGEGSKIDEVEELLKERIVDSIMLLSRALEERRHGRAMELVTHLNPFTFTRFHLDKWALLATKIPCAEAGGPARFTARVQLGAIKTFIDGLRTQAWTWPSMGDSAEICEAALRKLKAKMASSKLRPEPEPTPETSRSSSEARSKSGPSPPSNGISPAPSILVRSESSAPLPSASTSSHAQRSGSSHGRQSTSQPGTPASESGGYSLELYKRYMYSRAGTAYEPPPPPPQPPPPPPSADPHPMAENPYHHFASASSIGAINGRYTQPPPMPRPPIDGINPLLSFPLGGLPPEMGWTTQPGPSNAPMTEPWTHQPPMQQPGWPFDGVTPGSGMMPSNAQQGPMPMSMPHMDPADWERILMEASQTGQ